MSKFYNDKERYQLKVIALSGVTCVSVEGENRYHSNTHRKEPVGSLYPYRDKHKKRFQILRRLGLWENGRILQRNRRLQ